MERLSLTHILLFFATALFLALTSLAVSKMRRNWQNVMFVLAAVICVGGIFFRYGMGLNFDDHFTWKTLLLQMLQVCNFNFILIPLMFIPKLTLARQYAIYFSMFAASTTLFALGSDWVNYNWYDTYVLNSWLNHTFAIACPLWMIASRRARPERKYIVPVAICVFFYFTIVYLISESLIEAGIITEQTSFSFIYQTDGIPIMSTLHKLIPMPYFHLYPLFPLLLLFFVVFSIPFNKKLRFDSNGGEGFIKERTVPTYSVTQLPWRGVKREGYRLIGWSPDPYATEPEYDTGGGYLMGGTHAVLYAVWEPWGVEKKATGDDHAHYHEHTWGASCDECIMRDTCENVGKPDAMCELRRGETVYDSADDGIDFDALNEQFLSGIPAPLEVKELTDEELAALNPDFDEADFTLPDEE